MGRVEGSHQQVGFKADAECSTHILSNLPLPLQCTPATISTGYPESFCLRAPPLLSASALSAHRQTCSAGDEYILGAAVNQGLVATPTPALRLPLGGITPGACSTLAPGAPSRTELRPPTAVTCVVTPLPCPLPCAPTTASPTTSHRTACPQHPHLGSALGGT